MSYKICTVCNQNLPLDLFYKKRESHEGFCKTCKNNKRKEARAIDPSIQKAQLQKQKEYWANNPEALSARKDYLKGYYQINHETHRAWCTQWAKDNPEKRRSCYRKWQHANRDIVRFHANKRRTAKLRATPKWAEDEWQQFFVQECYNLAVLRQSLSGVEWHVDHIVPLQSKLVCGLHCASNLQVIPATANLSKHNKYWPDMP